MKTINIKVTDKCPAVESMTGSAVSDNTYQFKFKFDDEWQDGTKTFLLVNPWGEYTPFVMENDEITIEIPYDGRLSIGVIQGNTATSRPCIIEFKPSIKKLMGEQIPPPPDDVYTQIMSIINALEAAKLNPVEKTDDMTEPVGRDENGQLWAAPMGGGNVPSLVFDTVADMNAYIAENAESLKTGQDLLIRETGVPDYWWDGTKAVEAESKVDLSGYSTTEEMNQAISEAGEKKVSLPTNENGNPVNGTAGQYAKSDGQGGITWGYMPDGGSGLSGDEKTLLLNILSSAAFTNDDIGAAMGQLENLFAGNTAIEYAVTYNLTDVTADNEASNAKAGFPFTVTLTAADGMTIRDDTLSIIMGGEDITKSVYVDGVITIPIVTGEIIIIAQSKDANLIYALVKEALFDGTSETPYIDTGISLFDEDKSFSLLFEFSNGRNYSAVFAEALPTNVKEPYKNKEGYCFYGQSWGAAFGAAPPDVVYKGTDATNLKVVLTYDHTTNTHSQYYISDGVRTVATQTWDMSVLVGKTSGLRLGVGYSYSEYGFKGTIHKFVVYSKVIDDSTINEFLGVA